MCEYRRITWYVELKWLLRERTSHVQLINWVGISFLCDLFAFREIVFFKQFSVTGPDLLVSVLFRCLMSRNPIPASKEGLNLIFEEMKRRWDASEKVKLDLKAEAERGSRLIRGSRVRREIWIRGEGARRVHRTTSASGCTGEPLDQDLAALSVADLNKKFINTFLHLHVRFY